MNSGTKHVLPILVPALLTACANTETDRRVAELEQEVSELRYRIETLENAQPNEQRSTRVHCIKPEDLRAQLKSLWARRNALSLNYTEAHPDIRNVDKRIERLQQRLEDAESTIDACDEQSPASRD